MATPSGLLTMEDDDFDDFVGGNASSPSNLVTAVNLSSSPSTWMTDDDSEFNFYYFYETEQLTFLWIMFILIVVGNSAVLTALLLSKSNKKSRMNFFIMQLAIADLAVGLISVLTDIVWKITVSWNAGNVACKLIRYLQVVVTYSSTYVLVALSIDRYDAITRPMKFSGSWRRARLLVIVAWVMSALFSIPILILYEEAFINGQAQCWIDLKEPWKWQVYMTLVSVALFIIPAFIITACYTVIVFTIWSKGKTLMPAAHQPASSVKSSSTRCKKDQLKKLTNEVNSKRASSRGLIPKAKIKTVKMTFMIVFVFILCWSPYIVYDLLQVYGHLPQNQTQFAIATFIQSLAPLNSAANPIIYCLFSTHICRNLRKISLFNWAAEKLCLCCPPSGSSMNRGSDFTASDYLTSSSRSSSLHSSRLRGNSTVSSSLLKKQHVSATDSNASVATTRNSSNL